MHRSWDDLHSFDVCSLIVADDRIRNVMTLSSLYNTKQKKMRAGAPTCHANETGDRGEWEKLMLRGGFENKLTRRRLAAHRFRSARRLRTADRFRASRRFRAAGSLASCTTSVGPPDNSRRTEANVPTAPVLVPFREPDLPRGRRLSATSVSSSTRLTDNEVHNEMWLGSERVLDD
jgi:hypothetical protein